MKTLLVLGLFFVVANVACADAISQNQKVVGYQVQIDNLKDNDDFVFYIFPANSKSAKAPLRMEAGKAATLSGEKGSPSPFSGKNARELRLYAVPRKLVDAASGTALNEWFDGSFPAVLQSADKVNIIRSVLKTDTTTLIVTHYKVAIKDGKLTFTQASEHRFDSSGKEVPPGKLDKEETTLDQRMWFYLGVPLVALLLIGVSFLVRGKKPS